MTHEVSDHHTAHTLRRCATTPKESLSAPGERGDVRSADAILHSNPIRRSAAMTHEVSDRHTAHTLRRCATSHSLPSFRRARGMSAARTRYSIVTPIRGSAAMTHGDSGRHTAHALRRCATTPEESLSAPGERGDVRSADAILHSNPHSWERSDDE